MKQRDIGWRDQGDAFSARLTVSPSVRTGGVDGYREIGMMMLYSGDASSPGS